MTDQFFALPPVFLSSSLPDLLSPPKFLIGQQVCWLQTAVRDFGRIVGIVYADEASIQSLGYHYAVQLDANSPSTALGIGVDWGYEADLSLMPASSQANADATQFAPSQDADV